MGCARCGRPSHTAKDCYAKAHKSGETLSNLSEESSSEDESGECERCGRDSHEAAECYATKDIDGRTIKNKQSGLKKGNKKPRVVKDEIKGRKKPRVVKDEIKGSKKPRVVKDEIKIRGVYVLELDGRNFYIGKSEDISKRLKQHQSGKGSAWTKKHAFVREHTPMSPPMDDLDSWERVETLERAHFHGVNSVRGHVWTTVALTTPIKKDFVVHIRDRKNLCRKCGKSGHMVSYCRSKQNLEG